MAPIREENHSYLLKTLDSCILKLLRVSPPPPGRAWRGWAWMGRPAPLSDVEIQEQRDALTAVTPPGPGSRRTPPARSPSSVLQHQALHSAVPWADAGFSQLGFSFLFRDTVALFQYQHRLWGNFFFFKPTKKYLPLRQIPSAQHSLACQPGGKGSKEPLNSSSCKEVLPGEP